MCVKFIKLLKFFDWFCCERLHDIMHSVKVVGFRRQYLALWVCSSSLFEGSASVDDDFTVLCFRCKKHYRDQIIPLCCKQQIFTCWELFKGQFWRPNFGIHFSKLPKIGFVLSKSCRLKKYPKNKILWRFHFRRTSNNHLQRPGLPKLWSKWGF